MNRNQPASETACKNTAPNDHSYKIKQETDHSANREKKLNQFYLFTLLL